jgi:hypothetical protein|tara:strand:- start:3649 stop:3798 length:150 start_codon:yes stop_codon:yes gene_type:complete
MNDCPKCGWPGTPQTDEAFFFRYMVLTPEKKKVLRKMADVLAELDKTDD